MNTLPAGKGCYDGLPNESGRFEIICFCLKDDRPDATESIESYYPVLSVYENCLHAAIDTARHHHDALPYEVVVYRNGKHVWPGGTQRFPYPKKSL